MHIALMQVLKVHFAPWYRNPMKLQFSDDLKDIVGNEKSLEVPVSWASRSDVAEQYLNRAFGNAYDFSQADS